MPLTHGANRVIQQVQDLAYNERRRERVIEIWQRRERLRNNAVVVFKPHEYLFPAGTNPEALFMGGTKNPACQTSAKWMALPNDNYNFAYVVPPSRSSIHSKVVSEECPFGSFPKDERSDYSHSRSPRKSDCSPTRSPGRSDRSLSPTKCGRGSSRRMSDCSPAPYGQKSECSSGISARANREYAESSRSPPRRGGPFRQPVASADGACGIAARPTVDDHRKGAHASQAEHCSYEPSAPHQHGILPSHRGQSGYSSAPTPSQHRPYGANQGQSACASASPNRRLPQAPMVGNAPSQDLYSSPPSQHMREFAPTQQAQWHASSPNQHMHGCTPSQHMRGCAPPLHEYVPSPKRQIHDHNSSQQTQRRTPQSVSSDYTPAPAYHTGDQSPPYAFASPWIDPISQQHQPSRLPSILRRPPSNGCSASPPRSCASPNKRSSEYGTSPSPPRSERAAHIRPHPHDSLYEYAEWTARSRDGYQACKESNACREDNVRLRKNVSVMDPRDATFSDSSRVYGPADGDCIKSPDSVSRDVWAYDKPNVGIIDGVLYTSRAHGRGARNWVTTNQMYGANVLD